jgi:acetyl-CoA carboxylase beta subunit
MIVDRRDMRSKVASLVTLLQREPAPSPEVAEQA